MEHREYMAIGKTLTQNKEQIKITEEITDP
jgi:hypothetical protein